MITDIILVSIGFLWVIAASIFDVKTREIPDWLSFSLIAIGLGLRAIHSLAYWDYHYFLYGILGLAAFFVAGNLMYYTRQWGGGDAKLLMGLGAIFGSFTNIGLFNPNINLPFLVIILMNILIAGALYGIIYGVVLGILNWKKVIPVLKKQKRNYLILGVILSVTAFIIGLFIKEYGLLIDLFSLIAFVFSFVMFFMAAVEKTAMIKKVKINEIREGDWLHKDVIKNHEIICSSKGLGIEKKDIALLRKNKIKFVIIKDGLPFVPSFLIGMIVSFIFGNWLIIF